MITVAVLALWSLAAQAPSEPQAAPAGTFMIFGKPVAPVAPPVGPADYPPDVKSWPGWGPLKGEPVRPFFVDGIWSSVLSAPGATKPDGAAVPWRVKVFLISSVDFLSPDASGNVVARRTGIYGPTRDRIAQGLALAGAALQAETSGRLAVIFDTTEDPALYEETVAEGAGLGPKALEAYVAPRINGGSFEANDKLYHGPYHLCLVIHAGLSKHAACSACGTPVLSLAAPCEDTTVSGYAQSVLDAFRSAGSEWSSRQGRRPGEDKFGRTPALIPNVFGDQPLDKVAADVDFGPVVGSAFVDAMRAGPYQTTPFSDSSGLRLSPASANTQLTVGQDAAKGAVLNVKLSGVFPDGGFELPLPAFLATIQTSPDHFLVFDVRTASPDTLGLGVRCLDKAFVQGVALGQRTGPGPAIAMPNDNSWHRVAIDLSTFARIQAPEALYIGFLPDAALLPKASIQNTEYSFANFSLAASAPADALTVTESAGPAWEARAIAARAAAKAGPTPESLATLTQALVDPEELVRLNALTALAANKVPGLEGKITACFGTINPRISEAVAAALAFQDTPLAWSTLQQVLRVGPGTHAKVVAATLIAQRKDAASAGQISALQGAARDWADRLAIANALVANGTPQALVFLRTFLDDPDPSVRTTVAGLVPAGDDTGLHRLMFVSVNDPSDSARAAAAIKLLQSTASETKKEGYRGANDDSWWVRVAVLDWIAAHPTTDDRPALRQAILSPFGQVRVAALRAFTESAEPVTLEEIATVLKDQDPSVQRALIGLATAKKLILPPESVALLKGSIAADVAEAAKSLPGS